MKVIVSEQQLKMLKKELIKESLSNKVYHYTTIYSMSKIAKDDKMILQSSALSNSDNVNSKELYYLSFTRERNSQFGYSYKFNKGCARIEMDGSKLSQTMKGMPFDYWGSGLGKQSYYTTRHDLKNLSDNENDTDIERKQKELKRAQAMNDMGHHISSESEDRLLSRKPFINNVSKYINRVDIFINMNDDNETKEKHIIFTLKTLMSLFRKKIFVYDDLNEFNKQSQRTINEKILDFYADYDGRTYGDRMQRSSEKELTDILRIITAGEINGKKEIGKYCANLLKKYNLEKYLNGNLLSNVNNMYYYGGFSDFVRETLSSLRSIMDSRNEESHNILKILTDYMYKNKLRSISDIIKHKSKFGMYDENTMDMMTNKHKTVNVLVCDSKSSVDIIIPEPKKTNFWDIIRNKENFINAIYGAKIGNNNSKSDESFYSYLVKITNRNYSVEKILDILQKLNLDNTTIRRALGYKSFEYKELNFDEAVQYILPEFAYKENYYNSIDELKNKNIIRSLFYR